ncbi:MAG: hypothetical protein AB7P03_11055 [Kofleriaceae bacterium]
MTQPRSLPLLAIALLLAMTVAYAPILLGGNTWDDVAYHTEVTPPRLAAASAVQAGEPPAWWDGTGLGVPLLAEPAHGAMYPLQWWAASPRMLDLSMVLHLAWAALGVGMWARRRPPALSTGTSEIAALVAGVLVAASGVLVSSALRGALPALAQLPWLGLCAAGLASADTARAHARHAAGIGGLLGLIALAGSPAVFVDGLVIVLVLASARRRALGWASVAVACSAAVGAAQWIPAVAELGRGAGATVYGMPLARVLELVIPGSFGSSDPDRAVAALAGTSPWLPSLFAGAPLLALAGVRTPSRRILALVIALAAIALGWGRGGWPAWLGGPELHVAALVIVLGAHAGGGIDAVLAGDRRVLRVLIAAVGLLAICLAAVAALAASRDDAGAAIRRALLDGGLGWVCMLGAAVVVWRSPTRRLALALALALLVLPSMGALPSVAPTAPRSIVEQPPAWATAIANAAHGPAPPRVFRPSTMFESSPDLRDAMATLAGAAGWRWGIAAARSEDPARPGVHDAFWLAAYMEPGALLDRFGIPFAILPDSVVEGQRMKDLGRRGRWVLTSLPVAPPVGVLRGAQWATDLRDTTGWLFAAGGGTNVLRGTVVLEGTGKPRTDRGAPIACAIERWDPGAIDATCTSELEGYAAISSTPGAGWSATVDGQPASWFTADALRRAVAVPAGSHRIQWRYRAPGLVLGLAITAFGVVALGALAVLGRRRDGVA